MRGGGSEATDRGRLPAALLLAAAMAAGAAGCTGSDAEMADNSVRLEVAPAHDSDDLRPDSPVTVRARNGTVENVTVTTKGDPVEGTLNADRTEWRATWTLQPDTRYAVTATALGRDGRTRTATSQFRTAKADQVVATTIEAPYDKETVGVGIPIVLRFDREIADRAAVERALEVRSAKPVEGAWHWFGNQTVVFRTRKHWPRHTDASFTAHLAGVRTSKGTWGGRNQTVRFRIGDEHITKASENNHEMVVRKNGRVVRRMPISMGKGGRLKYVTTNGDHLTMDKENPVVMDSSTVGCPPGCPDYYRQVVYSAVRISNSGEYVHSAPWSVGSQGNSNVSHGCVNASPADARWFYDFSYRGDPFKVTGTIRELEPENGWGYWQLDWDDWAKGSALKRSLKIGPEGTTPVPLT
ncbi:L,D-transpeptidase [Actinomadura kijaniata]|uniref:L,D-transpeptidase n=1 Tax=Actinomadura kijaniata TaxID=46161 RepID=UPI000B2B9BEB|nr:Ig-like domain-containing protein [Actinomadura kijaniata]